MKTYECICPICEKRHSIVARFLSGTMTVIIKDGKEYVRLSCGNHPAEEVKRIYDNTIR